MPVLLSLPDCTSGSANIPTNPQSRGSTGMLARSALRHCAALTPQPAVLMTDVRTYLISEDGNHQGNQNDRILSYHFIPQILELESTFFSSRQEHVLSVCAMGGIHIYPQQPLRCCLQNTRNSRVVKYRGSQVTPTKYLCMCDYRCGTPLTYIQLSRSDTCSLTYSLRWSL